MFDIVRKVFLPRIDGNGQFFQEEFLVVGLDVGALDPPDPGDGVVEAEVLDHGGDHHAGTSGSAGAVDNAVSALKHTNTKGLTGTQAFLHAFF